MSKGDNARIAAKQLRQAARKLDKLAKILDDRVLYSVYTQGLRSEASSILSAVELRMNSITEDVRQREEEYQNS